MPRPAKLAGPVATERAGGGYTAWFSPAPSGGGDPLLPRAGEEPPRPRPDARGLGGRARVLAACASVGTLAGVVAVGSSGLSRARPPPAPRPSLRPGEVGLELLSLHPASSLRSAPFHEVARPAWVNRGRLGAADLGTSATSRPPRARPAPSRFAERLLGDAHCTALLERLEEVGKQELSPNSGDPLFPASEKSIAPPGADCGDSAAGIHTSCSRYNQWATFQDIAGRRGGKFEVMAGAGPDFHDIGQGELGTCYLLAALASIAHTDPHVIDAMFVRRDRWSSNIFTTRWLVNGKETLVQVDNNVPARDGARPFFVQPSSTGEWWPVILEKAWAKIHGSYKATEAGLWANPVQAITMAPVTRYHHETMDESTLFKHLQEAAKKGWPAGTGTGPNPNKYGLASGHAYSVLGASTSPDYGKVVRVYNPWNQDHYKGAVPNNDRSDGVFTMKLSEYKEAFEFTTIANVHHDYKITSRLIQTESRKVTMWEFTASFDEPFYITVAWPGHRMVKPCAMLDPTVTLAVRKRGSDELTTVPDARAWGVSSTSVRVPHGKGHYVAVAGLDFSEKDAVHEAHLIVYSASRVELKRGSGSAQDELMRMFAPTSDDGRACSTLSIPGHGLFTLRVDTVIFELPTYWSHDGAEFAYWVGAESKWFVAPHSYYQAVADGEVWSYQQVKRDEMSCGCRDDAAGVAGFVGVFCDRVKGSSAKYSNVKCEDTKYSKLVQRYCPATCGLDVCGGSAVDMPTAPPDLVPSEPKVCVDLHSPGISLHGKFASCAELGGYCHEFEAVRESCCAECAKQAEEGGVSNEQACRDHQPVGIRDSEGRAYDDCSALGDKCYEYEAVAERCCKTCQGESGVDGHFLCVDTRFPQWQPKDGTEHAACGYLKPFCWFEPVARECCATCGH